MLCQIPQCSKVFAASKRFVQKKKPLPLVSCLTTNLCWAVGTFEIKDGHFNPHFAIFVVRGESKERGLLKCGTITHLGAHGK